MNLDLDKGEYIKVIWFAWDTDNGMKWGLSDFERWLIDEKKHYLNVYVIEKFVHTKPFCFIVKQDARKYIL